MGLSYERRRVFLLVGLLICRTAISFAQTETTSSSSTPGQAIPGTGGVSSFAGSVPVKPVPGVLPLSLQDAIDRGLKQNLGLLLSHADIRSAQGQRWQQLSALLPHVTADPYVDASKINLAELGLTSFGGVRLPASVGPFSYFDARAAVTQSLFDWKSINATRAAKWSAAGEKCFIAGEDLTCQAGLAVQQDLALGALIGVAHAERNGHHYVDGFADTPAAEAEAFLAAHPDLYVRDGSTIRLAIHEGDLLTGSLRSPGFASSVHPDWAALSPLQQPKAKTLQEQSI